MNLKGPINLCDVVVDILKASNVPPEEVSVYEQAQDTGYPGLVNAFTAVNLNIGYKPLERKVYLQLEKIGFKENP